MLGRCLLRLQQYEQLMKAIVAHHEISASGSPLESNQAERVADAANKTLGTLVGTLLGTYVTSGDQDDVAEPDAPDNIISFKMKMSLRMSAEDFDTTQNDLKELVLLRNNLVHHFIDQHDLRCPTFSAFQPVALMLPFLADPVVRSSSAGTWSGTGIPGWSGGGSGCRTRRCTGTGRSQPRRASRNARHAPARS